MKNGKYEDEDGTVRYYLNDKLHRDDGPAVIQNYGGYTFYKNGICTNQNGPAIHYGGGNYCFHLDNVCLSRKEWAEKTNHKLCLKCLRFCQQNCVIVNL